MPKSQLKRTMEGAFILTIASFIAKILSAVYRVPFSEPGRGRRVLCVSTSLSDLWIGDDFGVVRFATVYFPHCR